MMAGTSPRAVMLVRNPFTHDTRVEKEAASLAKAGYAVTVVADRAPGLPSRETRATVTVRRIGRPFRHVPLLRFVAGELARARALASAHPTILHAHDSNALLAVWLAARRLRRPFIYDAHDLWLGRPRRERSRLYFRLNQAWYALIERLLVPRAAGWVTVSPPIAAHLARRYRLPAVSLVENFPEAEQARDAPSQSLRELAAGAIPDDAPIVLYLGGLMAGRGLEQLVDAMTHVPRAHLILLGDGQLAGDLADRAAALDIASRVHRLGPVAGDEVVRYARSADVGVSPIVPSCLNYRYSLPNKLFQYMAAGLPVVASDLPQVREVVETARAGQVVDTRSAQAIAAAVRNLLGDPAAARAAGARGRQAVIDRYHWEKSAARLLEVYEAVRRNLS